MNGLTKRQRPVAGASAQSRHNESLHPGTGRPPLQGNGNARHAGQRAPCWPDPPETAAMRLLGTLWGSQ